MDFRRIKDGELEERLKVLSGQERKLLHMILLHIGEVERRQIYAARAYPSMFEYLVKECRYSNAAAMRRLEAARLLREVPVAAQKVQSGELNLSQITELSRAVKEKQKELGQKLDTQCKAELVHMIIGKTVQETQKELSVALDLKLQEPETQRVQKDESVHLQLTLSKGQYQKLLACKDLLALKTEKKFDSSTAYVFELLMDLYLKKRAPSLVTNELLKIEKVQIQIKAFADVGSPSQQSFLTLTGS